MAKSKKDWIALYGDKNPKKPKKDWIALYGQNKEPEQPKEPEGFAGIGKDILSSLKKAPGALLAGLKELPEEAYGAGKQLFTDPARLSKNLLAGFAGFGQGAYNTPKNIADYLANKKLISEETANKFPHNEMDIFEALGGKGSEAGDAFLRGIASPANILGEAGAISGLRRAGARVGAGTFQAIGENEDPILGGINQAAIGQILESGINTATKAKRSLQNKPEEIKAKVSNALLNKATKDIETGGSLTPEQASQNALSNYTNTEGQPMGADFGSLIGNKLVQDIYNVSSKIPLSGGRAQLTKLDKQLFDKKEALAKIENEKEKGVISRQKQKYETDLRNSIADAEHAKQLEQVDIPRVNQELEQNRNQANQLETHTEQATGILNQFARPEVKHGDYFKQNASEAFNNVRQESNSLYEPVNDFEFNAQDIDKVGDFPNYIDSLRQHHEEATALRDVFGHSSDLGANVNNELNSALNFINSREKPTLGAILEHTRALGRLAEYAKEAGKRHESATLMQMRRALKEDAKNLLRKQGAEDVATSLEEADQHFINNVLPWYANKEIRKTVTEKGHRTEPQKFSQAIHGENAEPILNSLPPEVRKAAVFEILTGKAQTPGRQTTLTPHEIGNRYRTHLDPKVKESLMSIDPELNTYFEELSGHNNTLNQTSSQINRLESQQSHLQNRVDTITGRSTKQKSVAEEGLTRSEEKKVNADKKFQEAMKERFGKPKTKTKSVWATLKNFSPLNAAGLGTAIYAMGHLNPLKIAEIFGGSTLPARKLNKLLTELETEGKNKGLPKLLSHFVEGTKVTPKIKEAGSLEKKVRSAIKTPLIKGSYGSKQEKKPMELELIKAFNGGKAKATQKKQ